MNITLWVLQVLLAAAFFAHGWLLLMPPPEIAAQMLAELPRPFWVFLGVAEVLAAVGLTLPGITRILPGARAIRGRRPDVRHDLRHHLAPGPRRVLVGGHHRRASRHGDLHRLRTLAPAADPASPRRLTLREAQPGKLRPGLGGLPEGGRYTVTLGSGSAREIRIQTRR
jgi:hypothetical protein